MKNSHCPSCGELKVNVHKLDNGTYGVWCDNCLAGIPTVTLHSRRDIKQAISDYDFYKYFYYETKRKRTS